MGGDSVLVASYILGGGFCPRQQKRVGGGIMSGGGGDFVQHSPVKLADTSYT